MSKSRVPISWASRLILNKTLHPKPAFHQNETRHFSVTPEVSKRIYHLLADVDGEKQQRQRETGYLNEAFKSMVKLDKFEEKKQFSMYSTAKYTAIPACGNYNGVVGLAKATGLAVPTAFQKAYGKSFQTRIIHNLADGVKLLERRNDKVTGRWESLSSYSSKAEEPNQPNVRPLSPHLPVYKPQLNSTLSILNRVSGSYLAIIVSSFYLLYMKLGLVCFSFESFYQLLFYSSKLTLISAEMAALALVYHVYYGIRHLAADFLGKLGR